MAREYYSFGIKTVLALNVEPNLSKHLLFFGIMAQFNQEIIMINEQIMIRKAIDPSNNGSDRYLRIEQTKLKMVKKTLLK